MSKNVLIFLQGNTIFSKLDAAQGYFQIPMAAEDAHKTCFQNRFGSWEYRRLPFGLCGAPQTFSMAVHSILESLLFKIVMAYLDDIVVPSKNIFEHFVALQLVFDRLVSRGVKLKPSKCEFFQKEIEILGRIATGETMAMSEKDIEVVKKAARPTSKKQVEQWLGLASYHRQFMKDFGEFAWPLYQLVHSKKKFKWTIEHERAFQKLKDGLSSPPVLGLPREDCYFILDCDSSAHAIGAALVQDQGQGEVVIAYSSASLSKTQMGYCATKRKLLSLCYHVRHWRHYLLGKPFVVRTDHSSLRWLSKFKNTEGQLHRWIEELSAYDIEIVHRKGALHVNADSLSRLIEANHLKEDVPFDELPCGGCEKCRKEAKKWEVFNREVDDVQPLTAPTRPASPFKAQAETKEALLAAVEPEEAYELLSAELPFHAPQDLRGPRLRAVKHPGQLPTIPEAPEEAAARMAKARAGQCDISPELQAIFEEDQEDFEGFSEQDLLIPQITKQWGMSTTEVAEAQKNDPHLGPIHRWFYYSVIPTEARLKNTSKATRHYWLHKGQIKMINQVLYFEKASESKSMLLLPLEYKEKVFKKMHDDPLAGHMGREKTIQAVKDKFYWYGMTTDVKLYVANCHTCQRMKDGQRNAQHEMGMNPSGYVLERVHLDHQGPLPMTMKGNKHILLMVDAFSKFLWAAAVPDQKAETTAKQLIDWFTEYGMPGTLVTDQGKGFESELVKELCEKLDVTKVRCTPYRAKANGQIERYNKVVSTILRSYCSKNPMKWDEYLPSAIAAIRSRKSATTGLTPNKVFFGREITAPVDVEFGLPPGEKRKVQEYVQELIEDLETVHETVRKNILEKMKVNKKNYDLKVLQREYQVGDVVYIKDKTKIKDIPRKLRPVWKGPAMVIHKYSSFVYKCRLHQKTLIVNHDMMKPSTGKIPKWIERARKTDFTKFKEPDSTNGPHCICGGKYDGKLMLQCEYCDIWFHATCVGIAEGQEAHLQAYRCEECAEEHEEFRITYFDRYCISEDEDEVEDE